jgi:hypothetical protein
VPSIVRIAASAKEDSMSLATALRRSLVPALALLAGLAFAGSATASPVDAHLNGSYSVALTITQDDLSPSNVGVKVNRTYKYTCSGKCKTVQVARETSSSCCVKYTLRRVGKGVYEGSTSYPGKVYCKRGDQTLYEATGTQNETMHVKTLKKNAKGTATKLSGTLAITSPPLKAPITPPECAKLFADHGLGPGDRAEQHSKFTGTLK